MRVLHVTPAFFPATYWGGPIYSVYGLCNALTSIRGVSLRVCTTNTAGPARDQKVRATEFPMHYPAGYDVYFCDRWIGADIAPRLLTVLWSMVRWADIVHLTAVYSFPTIPALLACRLLRKPVVWSPRGALQRWGNSTKPVAKRVWEVACNALLRKEHAVLHVTATPEAHESRARVPNARIEIIPNGVDIPEPSSGREWMPGARLRLLYLGRLHPIKGIENLLLALKQAGDPSILLTICGTGEEDHVRKLRWMVRELKLEPQIDFRGHVEGDEKTLAFIESDICVVPSHSENFGMVVAEALAHGVPVIASTGTPWAEINDHGCGLWTDNSPPSLAAAISALRRRDLPDMGRRGRAWMQEAFGWEGIAARMHEVYRQLTER